MPKLNLRRVINKKNMKKTAKTIFIAGVWYYVGRLEDDNRRYESSKRVFNRSKKDVRNSKKRVGINERGYFSRRRRNVD